MTMPTPFQHLPPRDSWRDLIAAGMSTLKRADGTPLLQVRQPKPKPVKAVKTVEVKPKLPERKAGEKVNRYLRNL